MARIIETVEVHRIGSKSLSERGYGPGAFEGTSLIQGIPCHQTDGFNRATNYLTRWTVAYLGGEWSMIANASVIALVQIESDPVVTVLPGEVVCITDPDGADHYLRIYDPGRLQWLAVEEVSPVIEDNLDFSTNRPGNPTRLVVHPHNPS